MPIERRIPVFAVFAVLILAACAKDGEPRITAGIDGCASCGMLISDEQQAAAYVVDHEVHTFCSPGCLLESFERRRQAGEPAPAEIFFADSTGQGLQSAETVTFLLTDQVPTVMDWGILACADDASVRAHGHPDGEILDWTGLRTRRGKLDRTVELVLTPQGLEPEVVELEKGELVLWEIRGHDLDHDVALELFGYDELGEIVVPASGEGVRARLLLSRPGDGFPFVRADGETVGRLRVRGAHTDDEEAR